MRLLTLTDARSTMQRGRPWTFRMECTTGGSNKFWMATGRGRYEPVEIMWGGIGNKPQIRVKDWDYLEKVVPAKEAKGYVYVATQYVRVRQQTIDAFTASQGGQTAPVTPAPVTPAPVTPAHGGLWQHTTGGVQVRLQKDRIEVVFDNYPPQWVGTGQAGYQKFKPMLTNYCEAHMGTKVGIHWLAGGIFNIKTCDVSLYNALIGWLDSQIPPGGVPLPGPYARIRQIARTPTGWAALDGLGNQVLGLTKEGARKLLADYPQIQMAGL